MTGSRSEIADALARIEGEIREVMVIVEEPALPIPAAEEDIFAEMEPYMVNVDGFVDYSREAIYTRMEGE